MSTRKAQVWFIIPSANAERCDATLKIWKDRGYRTGALLNGPAFGAPLRNYCDMVVHQRSYPGWGNSVNLLARQFELGEEDGQSLLFVTGGDDMTPDPLLSPAEICGQFYERFPDGFGVMQPCGDRWMNNTQRICGSPFFGPAFARRWNQGAGPFHPDYHHFYADQELCEVTLANGLLWQRWDMTHHHDHWMRTGAPMPEYMKAPHSRFHIDEAVFNWRKANGWPGHEPIP